HVKTDGFLSLLISLCVLSLISASKINISLCTIVFEIHLQDGAMRWDENEGGWERLRPTSLPHPVFENDEIFEIFDFYLRFDNFKLKFQMATYPDFYINR